MLPVDWAWTALKAEISRTAAVAIRVADRRNRFKAGTTYLGSRRHQAISENSNNDLPQM
jgi:hypothetical protein